MDILGELLDIKADQEFKKHVQNIKAGRFKRDRKDADYRSRIIYAEKLRSFVYNPALMNDILSDWYLKQLFFRTFGYKGSLDFTIYPNAWLRDLPLLDIGEGCYLADNILLGTNMVSHNQKFIDVGPISIGDRTIFNQRCAVGNDVNIGKDCRIGFSVGIGIKSNVGDNVNVGEYSFIAHGVKIGKNVTIGQCSHIGNMSIIAEGVTLPDNTKIPAFSRVTKQGVFPRRKQQV